MSAWRTALLLVAAPALFPQAPPPTASLHGIVRDASTGVPIADAEVLVLNGGSERTEATTDAEGLFAFNNLAAGPARIRVFHFFLGGNMTQDVNVSADPNAPPVEIRLRTGGHITGRVLDQDGNPIRGVFVVALRRVYSMGKLEYIRAGGDDSTRDDGQYYIDGLEAGHDYIIQAHFDRSRDAKAISAEPEDPKIRKDIPAPTYYPSADSPERALAVPLQSGDTRDHIDIRMLRSASYCVSGVVDLASLGQPAGARLALTDRPPSVGVTQADLGPDGRFRICDLYPGDYSLAVDPPGRNAAAVGSASIALVDRDLDRVAVTPVVHLTSVTGVVAWDGTPPTLAQDASVLSLKVGGGLLGLAVSHRFPIPGPFSITTPRLGDEIALQVEAVPPGAYVKEILYNGVRLAGGATLPAVPGALLIKLGSDGARISAKIADKDGNPLPNISVAFFSASPDSASALASTLGAGSTDAQGIWTSPFLAPGRYVVVATDSLLETPPAAVSFEAVEALWLARGQAQTFDLTPGAVANVALTPRESSY